METIYECFSGYIWIKRGFSRCHDGLKEKEGIILMQGVKIFVHSMFGKPSEGHSIT